MAGSDWDGNAIRLLISLISEYGHTVSVSWLYLSYTRWSVVHPYILDSYLMLYDTTSYDTSAHAVYLHREYGSPCTG